MLLLEVVENDVPASLVPFSCSYTLQLWVLRRIPPAKQRCQIILLPSQILNSFYSSHPNTFYLSEIEVLSTFLFFYGLMLYTALCTFCVYVAGAYKVT